MINRTNNQLLLLFTFCVVLCRVANPASASDWPQWLGPNGNNVVAPSPSFDPDLDKWTIAWQSEVGLGYSAITIADGRGYTMGHDGDANTGSVLLDFDGQALSTKWSNRDLQNYVSGNPLVDGVLYGIDGHVKTVKSALYAIDFESGDVRWTVPKYGFASLIAVGDTLLILSEDGELVTASATADGYHEISRKKLLESLCWTPSTPTTGSTSTTTREPSSA